jgi:ankyrin repeat protein
MTALANEASLQEFPPLSPQVKLLEFQLKAAREKKQFGDAIRITNMMNLHTTKARELEEAEGKENSRQCALLKAEIKMLPTTPEEFDLYKAARDKDIAARTRMEALRSSAKGRQLGEELLKRAEKGDEDRVKKSLALGANVKVQTEHGWTALMKASLHGHHTIVKLLLDAGADVNHKGILHGETAFATAASNQDLPVLRALIAGGADINQGNMRGSTPLIEAADVGNPEIVKVLIDLDADVNHKGRAGWTALMKACYHGHTDIASMLVGAGANVQDHDELGNTALMFSAQEGHADAVRLLVEAGADLNHQSDSKATAVMKAAFANHTEVLKFLLGAGAQLHQTCADDETVRDKVMKFKLRGWEEALHLIDQHLALSGCASL